MVINIFISHSWNYSEHYIKLEEWIWGENWKVGDTPLVFINQSVPKNDPIHNAPTDKQLKAAIDSKIIQSDIIIIPMGMYANYSKWIQKEIDSSNELSKPILAINPWAQERKASVVAQSADKQVGWNKQSVMNGIWKLYNKY